MQKTLQQLREKGIHKVFLGQDFANFFSGIPAPKKQKCGFFQRIGFTLNGEDHYDLEGSLTDNAKIEEFDETPWHDICVTDCYHGEKEALLGFLDREFPGRWEYEAGRVLVVAGFQGFDADGNITTLGRGGSDTSGVALAAALKADECQIYTDVDGVYTTDPRVAPKAKKVDRISFEEMLEMASLGSKVLQIRSVEFAGKYQVPLRVLSSFDNDNDGAFDEEFKQNVGTLITTEAEDNMEQPIISGIAFNRDEAKLTILGVPDVPGVASKILSPIGAANIEVDMIIQNVEEDGTTDFTFTVNRGELAKAKKILEETATAIGAREVATRDDIVKVSIVGVGMRSHAGVASKMFTALAEEGINILMISTSEIKISVIIEENYLELAVRCLHTAFGLDREHGESSARA